VRDLLTIARRELLEQLRNRWMLVGLLLVAASTPLLMAWALRMRHLLGQLAGMGMGELALGGIDLPSGAPPELLLERLSWGLNTVLFGEGMALPGVLAAHAILHDRQTGALEAILATPVRGHAYVAGKLVGVIVVPTLMIYATALGCQLLAGPLPAVAGVSLPGSTDWWLAILLGTPLQASLFSLLGLVFSSLARDTRTAQQWTYVVLGLVPLAPGLWLAAPGRSLGAILAASAVLFVLALVGVPLVARIFHRGEVLCRTA